MSQEPDGCAVELLGAELQPARPNQKLIENERSIVGYKKAASGETAYALL